MTKLYKISYSECELLILIQNVKIPIDFSNSVCSSSMGPPSHSLPFAILHNTAIHIVTLFSKTAGFLKKRLTIRITYPLRMLRDSYSHLSHVNIKRRRLEGLVHSKARQIHKVPVSAGRATCRASPIWISRQTALESGLTLGARLLHSVHDRRHMAGQQREHQHGNEVHPRRRSGANWRREPRRLRGRQLTPAVRNTPPAVHNGEVESESEWLGDSVSGPGPQGLTFAGAPWVIGSAKGGRLYPKKVQCLLETG